MNVRSKLPISNPLPDSTFASLLHLNKTRLISDLIRAGKPVQSIERSAFTALLIQGDAFCFFNRQYIMYWESGGYGSQISVWAIHWASVHPLLSPLLQRSTLSKSQWYQHFQYFSYQCYQHFRCFLTWGCSAFITVTDTCILLLYLSLTHYLSVG